MEQSRHFEATIKSIQAKGETKVNKDGEILSEPEIVLTLAMPMTNDNIRAMNFLAAAKVAGEVNVDISTMQLTFAFDAENVTTAP